MTITASSSSLVATVANPTDHLLTDLDLSALARRLRARYPAFDIDLLVREYRRFLVLKLVHHDEHAILLSPSPMIDQVWCEHILDTRSYIGMCLAIGLWIQHDPDGAGGDDGFNRERRRANTSSLYAARFGPANQDVWDKEGIRRPFLTTADPFIGGGRSSGGLTCKQMEDREKVDGRKKLEAGGSVLKGAAGASAPVVVKSEPGADAPVARHLVRQREEVSEGGSADVTSEPGAGEPVAKKQRQSNRITIRLCELSGTIFEFPVRSSTIFQTVALQYAGFKGVELGHWRFLLDGVFLRKDLRQTMEELGIQDGDVIDVAECQGGCFHMIE